MSVDTASLVLHVLAATGIVAGGTVMAMAGTHVRSATRADTLATWAAFARRGGLLVAVAAGVSLLTGGHLAGAVWGDRGGFENPFITVGVVAWLLLIPVGPMVGGARLRRLVAAVEPLGTAEVPAEVHAEATHPVTWGAIGSTLGTAVGFVWIMQAKPGWAATVAIMLVTFALGWGAGMLTARR